MINLIPPRGHKVVLREYWVHMGSAWGFLLSGVFVAVLLLFIPSYVLVTSQLRTVEWEQSNTSDTEEMFQSAEEEISEANTAIMQLQRKREGAALSLVVDTLWNEAVSGITLRRIELTRTEEGALEPVEVQGGASTREALAAYKIALERAALFETATIPISNLAREADLSFEVTVTLSSARN